MEQDESGTSGKAQDDTMSTRSGLSILHEPPLLQQFAPGAEGTRDI